MVIDKKTKPKSEIAKDFGINSSTLTIIYKQRSAVMKHLSLILVTQNVTECDQGIIMRLKIVFYFFN